MFFCVCVVTFCFFTYFFSCYILTVPSVGFLSNVHIFLACNFLVFIHFFCIILFHSINYRYGNNIQAVHKYIRNKALNWFKCLCVCVVLQFTSIKRISKSVCMCEEILDCQLSK